MIKLNLTGKEQFILDEDKLKKIKNVYFSSGDGNIFLGNITFYDARLLEDGSIDANYVFEEDEKKMFSVIIDEINKIGNINPVSPSELKDLIIKM